MRAWTPSLGASLTATATYTFNYGTLATPVADPAGGAYATAQVVTLSAAPGATIRYTMDGTDPTAASPAYTAPLTLSAAVTLKARAFQADWTMSAVLTDTYTWPDTTPPTISAVVSPPPTAAWWHTAAVEVTFVCADETAIATCPEPIWVTADGAGQVVTGEAVDAAGNRATASVTVNLDRTPPRVRVHSPEAGDVLPPGTTFATVRGSVLEFGAGLAGLTCNGVAATVTGQAYGCSVAVSDGSTPVVLAATDVVGHTTTTTVTVAVGEAPAPVALTITPTTLTLVAGETRALRVVDERSRPVTGGTWTSSAPLVATVAETDGVVWVTTLAAGDATLTVTRDALIGEASVTVLAAGTALPSGTVLWTAAEADPTVPARATVLRAAPTGADTEAAPALFFVDEGSAWAGAVLARPAGRATRIRATTIEGRVLWARTLSDLAPYDGLVRHVAADSLGGLVLVLGSTYDSPEAWPQRVQRLDGLTGQIAWEYFADDGALSEVAIHPDGRVFVVDEAYHTADTDLVALDAETGTPQRWRLPWGEYQAFATGPIVREDGTVVLLTNPHDTCRSDATTDLRLLALDPDTGTLATTSVAGWPGACFFEPAEHRLLPDGGGGLLVAHRREGRVRHLDAAGTLSAETTLLPPSLASDGIEAEYVLGENAAYALVKRYANETYTAYEVAFDPLTLAVASYAERPGAPNLNLRFARAGSGVHASGPTVKNCAESDVEARGTLWAGWGLRPSLCSDQVILSADTPWSFRQGDVRGQNATTVWLLNDSALPVIFKAENCEEGLGVLAPQARRYKPIDGVKPPAWGGDWYKVLNGVGITIIGVGTPDKTIGLRRLVPDYPLFGAACADGGFLCSTLGGRRQEPEWSQLHRDWAFPALERSEVCAPVQPLP